MCELPLPTPDYDGDDDGDDDGDGFGDGDGDKYSHNPCSHVAGSCCRHLFINDQVYVWSVFIAICAF